jgi:hypothetical protein
MRGFGVPEQRIEAMILLAPYHRKVWQGWGSQQPSHHSALSTLAGAQAHKNFWNIPVLGWS